jgi:hypothetical protein
LQLDPLKVSFIKGTVESAQWELSDSGGHDQSIKAPKCGCAEGLSALQVAQMHRSIYRTGIPIRTTLVRIFIFKHENFSQNSFI